MGQADLKPHDFTRHDSHQSTHEPNGRAGAFDCTCVPGVPFTARNDVLLRRHRLHPTADQSDDFMMVPSCTPSMTCEVIALIRHASADRE
ncbi:hypothetical protein RSPO_c00118 [Ralstonia solanacearum Po82]|uniref:Uncharacterized protein n=1 Tax=Ralstonia solanacearum (strain Po82) TaxID=1031711 RepID=F6G606_RALS8|nr:hypothetical protein RSPO_c00118 [Ralstonia solanacearum Po82]